MKLQTIACAVAIATGGFSFYAINEAIAANNTAVVANSIVPTQEQAFGFASIGDLGRSVSII